VNGQIFFKTAVLKKLSFRTLISATHFARDAGEWRAHASASRIACNALPARSMWLAKLRLSSPLGMDKE
jgi:hypothetical protein